MKTQYEVLMADPEFRRLLSIEALVAEAAEIIATLMSDQNVSKADLARRLNKSRAWVTQLLSGKANMTVRTLAEVAHVLNAEVKLQAQRPNWGSAAKTSGSGQKPVVFKMDRYIVKPSIRAETMFRLQTDEMNPAVEDLARLNADGPSDSEYAA